jgi:uncharacterized protein
MKNTMSHETIRIEGIRRRFTEKESTLQSFIAESLQLSESCLHSVQIRKKALDARKKDKISFVYSVDITLDQSLSAELPEKLPRGWIMKACTSYEFNILAALEKPLPHRPVITGSGPCGLFAALVLAEAGHQPLILERGKPVDDRIDDVNALMEQGHLNPESNIQFGEGGAGTFSDGKLYTLINDPRSQFIFDTLVQAGAPEEIAWDAKPHIGTDNLQKIVQNLRDHIIRLGGEFHFNSRVTDCIISDKEIQAVQVNHQEEIETRHLILAIGHSARDTVEMLFSRQLDMAPKSFSMGLRIEHLAEWIQKSQYGNFCNDDRLPSAKYKLAVHLPGKVSVYTFCMCPGGFVVPAASEPEGVVTNGMSFYAQNNVNSNSALLVNITPEDFGTHPLAGIAYQREWEKKAYQAGGGNFTAPVQLTGDFLKGRLSRKFGKVFPSYLPDTQFADLSLCLPPKVTQALQAALPKLNNKLKGFAHPESLLTGIESRSSSPVRILRNENLESNIRGIFPGGEGAGYAGGIVSSAVDGIRIAEQILKIH